MNTHRAVNLKANLNSAVDQNLFLAALPVATKASVRAQLKLVKLQAGEVLEHHRRGANSIFFPTDSLISLQCMVEEGVSNEIMTVSREGLVGVASCLSLGLGQGQAVVQKGGSAFCLCGDFFDRISAGDDALRSLMLRYMQYIFEGTAQCAACNCHHSLEQQLCKKLLLSHDEFPDANVYLTHETISNAFGVRRESVTQVAKRLRENNAINYRRGNITVLDRDQLEQLSCECYELLKTQKQSFRHDLKHTSPPAMFRRTAPELSRISA